MNEVFYVVEMTLAGFGLMITLGVMFGITAGIYKAVKKLISKVI